MTSSFGDDAVNYATKGASLGGSIPGVGLVGGLIGAGAGLGLAGVKYLLGSAQRKAANAIHPFNPGYQVNQEVIDNSRILGDRYGNYQLPGYGQLMDNLKGNFNQSIENANRGATSSADVLDAANKSNATLGQQQEQLAVQNAQGKDSALTQYLAAKAQAGQEMQNKNEYDRNEYEKQVQLKNGLNNNATANQYGAADQAGKLVSSIFSYRGVPQTPGPQGQVAQQPGIFGLTPRAADGSNYNQQPNYSY